MNAIRHTFPSLAFLAFASVTARAQVYERIDIDVIGGSSDGVGSCGISHDGRTVVFTSTATSLGGPDVSQTMDVFVRDRQLATTTRITSSLTQATQVNGSEGVRISGDGTVIAFHRGQPTAVQRAYVSVLATGVVTEVLVPNLVDLRINALNQDGTYAVLTARTSIATAPQQVYRLHIASGALVLCSRDANGSPVGGTGAAIDDPGTRVVFNSESAQVVAGDTNAVRDAFIYDIPGNQMMRASVGANGEEANLSSLATSISGDGRFVGMLSMASNLVLGDTNARQDGFVRDLLLEVTSIVSLATSSAQLSNGVGGGLYLSADGSSAAFASETQIHPTDSPLLLNTFLRDIEVGALLPSSTGSTVSLQSCFAHGITRDGREVLLTSLQAPMLINGGGSGVFVAKFGPRCSSSGYCTALPSSTGEAASIGAQGDASIALDNLVISAVGLPDGTSAMLASGTSAVDPGTPFGNGLLCIGGALIRHGVHVANGGVILDAQHMQSPEYVGVAPGDTRYYQVVYRDVPAGGAMFNTTDAVAITFCW